MFGKAKENSILTQRDGVEKIIFGIVFAILSIQCLTILVPLFFMFTNSFKAGMEFTTTNLWDFPRTWRWSNWKDAFGYLVVGDSKETEVTFIGMVWNSLWITFSRATILSLTALSIANTFFGE